MPSSKESPEKTISERSSQSESEVSDEGSPIKSKADEIVGDQSNYAVVVDEAAANTSKEAEQVRGVQTSENNGRLVELDSDETTAEAIKRVGGGFHATRDSTRFTPGSGGAYGPHPVCEDHPKKLPEEVAYESRPTDSVESSQEEGVDSTDTLYRRMFFLRHFQFDDIIVHINGQTVLIDAKHGNYADEHGFVSRIYARTHLLPEHVIADKLTSYFTGDGVLVIEAPYSKIL